MNRLYPLKFKPIFKEKVWGGQRIGTILGMDFSPLHNCGEAWIISGVEGENTIVENGFLAGNELNELVEVYMDNLVGGPAFDAYSETFPILIKFIDANAYLSIQVHPDDELAAIRHQSPGKTEMWYIIHADKDAELISGFRKKVGREEYIHHLQDKTLKNILNVEKVTAGDVFYVPAGRIHSLGPGILLAEIQQTSDITYRIYDWDRKDSTGHSRELHTALALDAMDFEVYENYRTSYSPQLNHPVNLLDTPFFTTNLMTLTKKLERDYSELDSFVVYVCTEGAFQLGYRDGIMPVNMGEAVLIPAELTGIQLNPQPKTTFLEVYLSE
jgi:mannose-6-phosphate isomerase